MTLILHNYKVYILIIIGFLKTNFRLMLDTFLFLLINIVTPIITGSVFDFQKNIQFFYDYVMYENVFFSKPRYQTIDYCLESKYDHPPRMGIVTL